jgi:hypothetical protein
MDAIGALERSESAACDDLPALFFQYVKELTHLLFFYNFELLELSKSQNMLK